jgi:putative ABC transport system permease protein
MSHSVTRRTAEMGIRMALGARPADVVKLVMGQGLRVVVVGLAVGLAGALALAGAMRGLLFGVQAHDPVTLLTVAAALLAVAVLACWLPARRAVQLQPVAALRSGGDD